jgi:arsenate reductase
MTVTIYHNPACGTSRNTLALIRNSGVEPLIIDYLTQPPTRAVLDELIRSAGLTVRQAIREKGTPYAELGLDNPALTDDALLAAMRAGPFVITPLGVRLCRPSELVLDILVDAQRAAFSKEDGEAVITDSGKRIQP